MDSEYGGTESSSLDGLGPIKFVRSGGISTAKWLRLDENQMNSEDQEHPLFDGTTIWNFGISIGAYTDNSLELRVFS